MIPVKLKRPFSHFIKDKSWYKAKAPPNALWNMKSAHISMKIGDL